MRIGWLAIISPDFSILQPVGVSRIVLPRQTIRREPIRPGMEHADETSENLKELDNRVTKSVTLDIEDVEFCRLVSLWSTMGSDSRNRLLKLAQRLGKRP